MDESFNSKTAPQQLYALDTTWEWVRDVASEFTEEQRKNYALLRDGLRMVSNATFGMSSFVSGGNIHIEDGKYLLSYIKDSVTNPENLCGTTACCAGWAPRFGIGNITDSMEKMPCTTEIGVDYNAYVVKTFGASPSRNFGEDAQRAWNWIFDSAWDDHDNSAVGAAIRIDIFLNYGVPANFNGWDPMSMMAGPLHGVEGFYDSEVEEGYASSLTEDDHWTIYIMPAVQMSDVLAGKISQTQEVENA